MANGNMTSPESILMLCIAAVFDGIGFILLLFMIDDLGILDLVAALVIGGWLFIRKGSASASKVVNKFLVALGFEALPYLGGISPSWIILVWKILKSS